jgi:hypothetical protein
MKKTILKNEFDPWDDTEEIQVKTDNKDDFFTAIINALLIYKDGNFEIFISEAMKNYNSMSGRKKTDSAQEQMEALRLCYWEFIRQGVLLPGFVRSNESRYFDLQRYQLTPKGERMLRDGTAREILQNYFPE